MAGFDNKTLKGALLAFAVTLAVFVPSVRYEFVYLDDPEYVMDNPHLQNGLTGESLRWAFTSRNYAANWHPLTWVSLAADLSVARAVSGEWSLRRKKGRDGGLLPNLMHAHNVVLHAINAALLFLLLSMMARGRLSVFWPLLLSLLWALHPLRVEVVCWITERKELLSVLFMLLSLMAYLKGHRFSYSFSLLFFILALLAKPVAVTLPAVILAWDWIVGGRPRWGRLIPFVALSLAVCFMTIGAQDEAIVNGHESTLASRLATSFVGPLVYLRQAVWPFGLSAWYPVADRIDYVAVAAGGLLVVGVVSIGVAWLWMRARQRRHPLLDIAAFAVAWVYVGLVPMLGIVKVGGQEHNDRYTYWIGCGVSAVLLLLALRLKEHWGAICAWLTAKADLRESADEFRRKCAMVLVGLLAVLTCVTWVQEPTWRNATVFFGRTLVKCWDPEFAFGFAIQKAREGDRGFAEGEAWLRQCAVRRPNVGPYVKLAKFLLMKKTVVIPGMEDYTNVEAKRLIQDVLETDPNHKEALELKELLEKAEKEGKR